MNREKGPEHFRVMSRPAQCFYERKREYYAARISGVLRNG
jgi:hypothetical protein